MSEWIKEPMKFVSTVKAVEKQGDEKYIYIKGIASTDDKDRHNDVIPKSLWTDEVLNAFMKNPVLLNGHNHGDIAGKITSLSVVEEGLEIEAKVLKSHVQPNGQKTSELIEEELLKGLSISFITKKWDFDSKDGHYVWIAEDIELLEISLVAVGANAEAQFSVAKSLGDKYEAFKSKHSKNSKNMFEKIKSWFSSEATEDEKAQVKALVSEKEVETPEAETPETPEAETPETDTPEETPEAVTDDTPETAEKSAEQKEIEKLKADKAALEAKLAKKEAKPVKTDKAGDPNPTELTDKKLTPMQEGWEENAKALRNLKR